MEENLKDFIDQSKAVVSSYVETRWKLLRLTLAGKSVHILGLFMTVIIAAMLGFFVVLFLGLLLAFWIADMSGSFTIGFAAAALVFILLFIIAFVFRKKLILIPVSNVLIREMVEEMQRKEEVEQEDPEDETDEASYYA